MNLKKVFVKCKYVIFIFLFVFCLVSFGFSAYAENISLYGSVNAETSQVNTLLGFLPNEVNYKLGDKYLVARINDYQYRCYYGNIPDSYYYLDYSRYQLGNYSYEWRITRGTGTNLNITTNNYTYVSNTSGGIYKSIESYFSDKFIVWLLPVIAIILIFYIFKPAKGVRL